MHSREGIVLVCAAIFLFAIINANCSEAKHIGYGVVKGGRHPFCKGPKCRGQASNPYQRGCVDKQRCRGNPGREEGEYQEEIEMLPGLAPAPSPLPETYYNVDGNDGDHAKNDASSHNKAFKPGRPLAKGFKPIDV